MVTLFYKYYCIKQNSSKCGLLSCKIQILLSIGQTSEELDEECIYMAGNSLGIRPKKSEYYMNLVMDQWRDQ